MSKAKKHARLSYERAEAACLALSRASNHICDYIGNLQHHGFGAFLPYLSYVESYAANEHEKSLHRKYLAAFAESELRAPWPMSLKLGQRQKYWSNSIALQRELELLRDDFNGCAVEELEIEYPGQRWREELDPCRRRMLQFEVEDRGEAQLRRAEISALRTRIFKNEANSFRSRHSVAASFDLPRRVELAISVMEECLRPHAFVFDREKSISFPVLSRPISPSWDISWALEERSALMGPMRAGSFKPYLQIRPSSMRGSVDGRDPESFLIIRYQQLIMGFGVAYESFSTPWELECAIRAHMELYEAISSIVEGEMAAILAAS